MKKHKTVAVLVIVYLIGLVESRQLAKRHHSEEKAAHFAPRLQHQPASATVPVNEPHTVECAVESNPDAEIKWFKDDQLLASQPPHLDQLAGELMFMHVTDDDSGEYHCQASNYLGTITSDPFQLTVQSSVPDPMIRFEPQVAQVGPEQMAEFTCKIPQQRNNKRPDVEWRRNGRRLAVRWISSGDLDVENTEKQIGSSMAGRHLARQIAAGEFVLTLARSQPKDDNSTFTCLYRPAAQDGGAQNASLLRESAPVRVRVLDHVKLDVNLAPPIDNLADSRGQQTTRLQEPQLPRRLSSLRETLQDLYGQPSLLALLLILLVGLMLSLQLICIRRRTRQNRYMKHQFCNTQGSNGSSASGIVADCAADPVLSSLMGRTLSSAPSAASLGGGGAANKKYRSCRDHLRKVAAANHCDQLTSADFVDGYIAQQQQRLLQQHQQLDQELLLGAAQLQPSLFNQSLAARVQARSLLQASEHMRSLSNLSHLQQQQTNKRFGSQANQNGSHLNLPSAVSALGGPPLDGSDRLKVISNALWYQYLVSGQNQRQQPQQQQQQQQQQQPQSQSQKGKADENYQLVNCASSSSPSSESSESMTAAPSHLATTVMEGSTARQVAARDSSSLNHYSTIDTNGEEEEDDDDCRYEELDHRPASIKRTAISGQHHRSDSCSSSRASRTSTFGPSEQPPMINSKSYLRASMISNSANSSSAYSQGADSNATTGSLVSEAFSRFGSKRNSRQSTSPKSKNLDAPTKTSQSTKKSYPDQLSPYAVSSICSHLPSSHNQQSPPVNSEAMKALNEQFDINKLMLLDAEETPLGPQQMLPFSVPPPPPPPAGSDK